MMLVEVVIAKAVYGTGVEFEDILAVRHDETQYIHPNTINAVRSGHQPEAPKGQVFVTTTEIRMTDGQQITVIGTCGEIVKRINEALR